MNLRQNLAELYFGQPITEDIKILALVGEAYKKADEILDLTEEWIRRNGNLGTLLEFRDQRRKDNCTATVGRQSNKIYNVQVMKSEQNLYRAPNPDNKRTTELVNYLKCEYCTKCGGFITEQTKPTMLELDSNQS